MPRASRPAFWDEPVDASFFCCGSAAKHFHNRNVSSAADDTTVEPSGDNAKFRILEVWPADNVTTWLNKLIFNLINKYRGIYWCCRQKTPTSELGNSRHGWVFPDDKFIVCIAVSWNQLLMLLRPHQATHLYTSQGRIHEQYKQTKSNYRQFYRDEHIINCVIEVIIQSLI